SNHWMTFALITTRLGFPVPYFCTACLICSEALSAAACAGGGTAACVCGPAGNCSEKISSIRTSEILRSALSTVHPHLLPEPVRDDSLEHLIDPVMEAVEVLGKLFPAEHDRAVDVHIHDEQLLANLSRIVGVRHPVLEPERRLTVVHLQHV